MKIYEKLKLNNKLDKKKVLNAKKLKRIENNNFDKSINTIDTNKNILIIKILVKGIFLENIIIKKIRIIKKAYELK